MAQVFGYIALWWLSASRFIRFMCLHLKWIIYLAVYKRYVFINVPYANIAIEGMVDDGSCSSELREIR